MEINDPTLKYVIIAWFLIALCMAFFNAWKHNRNFDTFNRKKQIRKRVEMINFELLDMGLSTDEIMEFWEECMSEALICHSLPPCRCKDVNECDTWCRSKARFSMNPPD